MVPTSPCGLSGAPAAAEGLLVQIHDLRAPTRRRLTVTGELDLATVGLLRSSISGAATYGHHVELELSGVTFCDVVGATAIEQAQQQVQTHGGQLTLLGIDGPLHLLLAVDGLFDALRAARLDGHQPPSPGRPRQP